MGRARSHARRGLRLFAVEAGVVLAFLVYAVLLAFLLTVLT